MGFHSQRANLRLEIRRRIDEGQFTWTELAKLAGMSQPGLWNFVNKDHGMSDENLDNLMKVLKVREQDLMAPTVPATQSSGETIPIVRHQAASSVRVITPAHTLRKGDISALHVAKLPSLADADRQDWTRFVAIQASQAQAQFMHPIIREGATLVIDRHYQRIAFTYRGEHTIYAIAAENAIIIVGFLEARGQELILRSTDTDLPLHFVPLGKSWAVSRLIIGRVCAILNDH